MRRRRAMAAVAAAILLPILMPTVASADDAHYPIVVVGGVVVDPAGTMTDIAMQASTVVFSPDGDQIWGTSFYGALVDVLDRDSGAVTEMELREYWGNVYGRGRYQRIAMAPDGSEAYVLSADSYRVKAIDTTTHAVRASEVLTNAVYPSDVPGPLLVSPDGERIYIGGFADSLQSGDMSNSLIMLDAETLTQRHVITAFHPITNAKIAPDGSIWLMHGRRDPYQGGPDISVVDPETLTVRQTFTYTWVPSEPDYPTLNNMDVAFSPDGRAFVHGLRHGWVGVLDATDGTLLDEFRTPDPAMYTHGYDFAAVSPDGDTLFLLHGEYETDGGWFGAYDTQTLELADIPFTWRWTGTTPTPGYMRWSGDTRAVTYEPAQAPTPAFTTQINGATVTVDGSASVPATDRTIVGYEWDFGDGTEPVVTQDPVTTHEYGAPGTYAISLRAVDDDGGDGRGYYDGRSWVRRFGDAATQTVDVTFEAVPPGIVFVVENGGSYQSVAGENVDLKLTVTGGPADVTAEGLPDGVSLSADTRSLRASVNAASALRLTGAPSAQGSYPVTFTATTAAGTTTFSFTWTVSAAAASGTGSATATAGQGTSASQATAGQAGPALPRTGTLAGPLAVIAGALVAAGLVVIVIRRRLAR